MIQLTRMNRTPVVVNADLIEFLEATPDTIVSLTTGKRLVVLETVAEIVAMVIAYRRACQEVGATTESEILKKKELAGRSRITI
ncbi:MAG: flagellar FlbD family protein [Heliobacteriaceae bacterium]|nr:flagellar FlbD family protein [Heliobacteriaceae bacterium]